MVLLRTLGLRLAVGIGALTMVSPLAAQRSWGASYYPYLVKGPNEKLSLVLHYQYSQPAGYTDRVPNARSLSLEAGANADGGRFAIARFKAPLLADGWRLAAEAGAVRQSRYGYFGLGNDTEGEDEAAGPFFNRVRRTRYYARADLTRRIVGPLQLALGGGVTDASYSALPEDSRFRRDCAGPPPPGFPAGGGDCADATDWVGRVGLVLDTRNDEFVTERGVLLDGGFLFGSGGDGYDGLYGIAEGFVSPREGTVVAARVIGRHLDRGAPLEARSTLLAWERSIPVAGGPESHRSFLLGRYTGRDLVLANLEVRQDILNFGDFGAISALAFLDAARVRERAPGESHGFHPGGGTGLAIRILRATVLTFNWAWGGDGYQFSMGTGWMF